MTTPKARYGGDDTGVLIPDFPQALRGKLRRRILAHRTHGKGGRSSQPLFTAEQIGEFRDFVQGAGDGGWREAHPADAIADELLSAAYSFKVELYRHRAFALKKDELIAEHADLLTTLRVTAKKLRSVSMEVDRLLDTKSDPLGVADQIDGLVASVERATPRVQRSPARQRNRVFSGQVAIRLAQAVMRVFEFNLLPTTVSIETGKDSLLIDTLKAMGEAMGLALTGRAWKVHVTAARKASRTASADR